MMVGQEFTFLDMGVAKTLFLLARLWRKLAKVSIAYDCHEQMLAALAMQVPAESMDAVISTTRERSKQEDWMEEVLYDSAAFCMLTIQRPSLIGDVLLMNCTLRSFDEN
jgi:hypothetical protein